MFYLVAADGDTLDSTISKRFGHAAYHLLVDADTREIIASSGDVENMPRHGIDRFQKEEVAGVISGNIGPHAFDDIHSMGWDVFIVRNTTVADALDKVISGEVRRSEQPSMKQSIHQGRGQGGGHHAGDNPGPSAGHGYGHDHDGERGRHRGGGGRHRGGG